MHTAVVLVGDELLSGHTQDANGYFLAKRLTALGHRVRRIIVVPDEPNAIVDAVDRALAIADFVFVSGGLGPTHDDRTTETLAERFGRRLVLDPDAWNTMLRRYGGRYKDGIPPHIEAAARLMVTVPEGAEVLANPVGAAPGYVLREGARSVAVFPGVPAELQAIFEQGVVGHHIPIDAPPTLVELDVYLAEAAFAHALGEIADEFPDLEIGSYPHHGEPHVTLRFRGDSDRVNAAIAVFHERVPDSK